ncbi:MAG TPA: trypsin-like serine protease [Anaerolineales bacterium]|nr:trypsin-like serine protease [Anaerolineales bacterium]
MMRKKLFVSIVVVLLALVMAVPAGAITKNWVNDFDHPFVGLVVFYDESGQFSHRCSGSLLDSTTFLTAGHCTAGVSSARVYFQQDAGANFDPVTQVDPITGYPETCAGATLGVVCATSDELYDFDFANGGFPNTNDVGLVILGQPIELSEYGELPSDGELDDLATARGTKDTIFTVSGYGLTLSQQPHNGKPNTSFRSRLMAESTLVNLGSALTDGFNLQTQGNGNGRGGTCSGDSGGPVFLGDPNSNLIVGVTSFGLNPICRGTDFAYRVDRQEVIDWINSH